jgi:DNA polymerase III subunit epsilon
MRPDQEERVRALIGTLTGTAAGREMLASALQASGHALMRQATLDAFPSCTDPDRLASARTGIILDSETTGLEGHDEVVELAMLRFRFDAGGILALDAVFNELREPSVPISEEASRVTGITAETVAGCRISADQIRDFMKGAELVIAHNAAFDRQMVERTFPGAGFDEIAWHCSFAQVDWLSRGKNGRSLEVLALSEGFVYGSHRADADVIATALVLNGKGSETPFAELLRNGERNTIHVIAKDSRFDAKDALKAGGFRWSSDGSDAYGHKAWHKEIPDTPEELSALAGLIRSPAVFGKEMSLPAFRISALTRYSGRKPASGQENFRTAEFRNLQEEFEARVPDQPSLF